MRGVLLFASVLALLMFSAEVSAQACVACVPQAQAPAVIYQPQVVYRPMQLKAVESRQVVQPTRWFNRWLGPGYRYKGTEYRAIYEPMPQPQPQPQPVQPQAITRTIYRG